MAITAMPAMKKKGLPMAGPVFCPDFARFNQQ
jgi:hypothetical protein